VGLYIKTFTAITNSVEQQTNGTVHSKKWKQMFEYQQLLLLTGG
jgi:hypothetical protein